MEPSVTPRPEWNTGKGDHDRPFTFGQPPSERSPFPFTTREYVRLLIMRARIDDQSQFRDRYANVLNEPEEPLDVIHTQSQPRDGAEAPGPESSGDSTAG